MQRPANIDALFRHLDTADGPVVVQMAKADALALLRYVRWLESQLARPEIARVSALLGPLVPEAWDAVVARAEGRL